MFVCEKSRLVIRIWLNPGAPGVRILVPKEIGRKEWKTPIWWFQSFKDVLRVFALWVEGKRRLEF